MGECHGAVPNVYVTSAPPSPLGPQVAAHPIFPPMRETGWCAVHPKFSWHESVTIAVDEPVAGAA